MRALKTIEIDGNPDAICELTNAPYEFCYDDVVAGVQPEEPLKKIFNWKHVAISNNEGFSTFNEAIDWLNKEIEAVMAGKVIEILWRKEPSIIEVCDFDSQTIQFFPCARFSVR